MDEERFWQAIQRKDAQFDGTFVFAVQTTGIYCRPSCGARRPRREHVQFFGSAEAAESAGFRACRRCRPREASDRELQQALVEKVCRFIEANPDAPLTLDALGRQVAVSPYHLQRTFKRLLGVTPRQYADTCRLAKLKAQLRDNETVASAAYASGYGSSRSLYERTPAQLGMTPGAYRQGGRGMLIVYAIADSPLGRLLVGATARGVCAVSLGDSDGELESALRAEYPAADIQRDDGALGEWLSALLRHLNGERPRLELPLDVQATAFQRRVWQELQSIPYGSTRTYREIAQALGQPNAARAVARACATNPVSLVIPCHRVVREDGGLGGYRWGLERKRALVAREAGQRST